MEDPSSSVDSDDNLFDTDVITYCISIDYTNEYLCIGGDTTLESVQNFAEMVIKFFSAEYLRYPNKEDMQRLVAMNEARG